MTTTSLSQSLEREFLSAFFSDGTERFRSPAEPDPGQTVTLRLRAPRLEGLRVFLWTGDGALLPMGGRGAGPLFELFEAELVCPESPLNYDFLIEYLDRRYVYQRNGARRLEPDCLPHPRFHFRLTPGFHTPEWARGAVQYQIFPDRFRNGDRSNDVRTGEYSYNHSHVRRIRDWDRPPVPDDYRCFYGGDLAGILEKLDYLEGLGVETLYLNPIFLSPSSHKYDAQDYSHIDPHLGVIQEDLDARLQPWEHHNGYAQRYIARVLSRRNLEASDALFARLCQELHRRGMRIILDGVFNHCGSFHRWMDREGIYREKPGYPPGAWQDRNSPYRDYFRFTDARPGFEAWWGVETLPKLCYEQSRALCEEIFSVAEKWLRPPYSIDGWRLDVAADLGHGPQFNHAFWKEFRARVRAVNPEAVILAEHYGDPAPWLQGDEWDTVMNYDAFMEPVTWFLTGMEKHSDGTREDLYQNGERFFELMGEMMARLPFPSLQCAMNQLSNHDHSRFLTRTNRRVGRLQTLGPEAAGEGVHKAVLREAVVIQMTWPGAPTIYYADEAGQVGWTDPDNRRTYPWGREDRDLIELHRRLIALRRERSVLRTGSLLPLGGGWGWIAYGRFDDRDRVVTVCNNGHTPVTLSLRLRDLGAEEGEEYLQVFRTGNDGFTCGETPVGRVCYGELELTAPPRSALVLARGQ